MPIQKRVTAQVAAKPVLKKPVFKVPTTALPPAGIVLARADLKESTTLKVFDIPIDRLVAHSENPNEQSEKTFDEIVERIRTDGFDEPIIVVPELKNGQPTQKFLIFSGHHRVKAAKALGWVKVPAVIREGWNEDRILIELVSRNQLRGNLSPFKFTELWDKLKKRYDPELLKRQMGLTEKKQFDALFKQVRDQLPAKAKAKLDEAKERVNSVEDLSSVLNEIFTSNGSEVDNSFLVMSYGGKKHTYIQIDAATQSALEKLQDRLSKEKFRGGEFFKAVLQDPTLSDNVIGKLRNAHTPTPKIARPKNSK